MVVDQIKKETMIIDVGILGDTKICDKERERLRRRNCQIMAYEKCRCHSHCNWSIRSCNNKVFKKYIESLRIEIRIEHVQKSALLGTAII